MTMTLGFPVTFRVLCVSTGFAGADTGVPHAEQNLASSGNSVPHFLQYGIMLTFLIHRPLNVLNLSF